jgi:hypothetical protein
MNVERAVVLQRIAFISNARATPPAPPPASASASPAQAPAPVPAAASACFSVTISGPFVEERLSPRWRSIVINIEPDVSWCAWKCKELVLYLRLVHQLVFSTPMATACVVRELRGDLLIDVGTTSDMSCDLVIKSPVFSGSLLSWQMGRVGAGHEHSLSTMKELLIKVNVKNELYLRSVVFPLLCCLGV